MGKDSIYMILYAISIQYLIRNVQVRFFCYINLIENYKLDGVIVGDQIWYLL